MTDTAEKSIISFQDTLYYGDTLKIKFKTPHPTDFAITTPNDGFFFVVYDGNDSTMPSLVDSEKFRTMSYLEIVTNETKANPWNRQFSENQIIFSTSGKYELRLSNNLETDDGTPVESEIIIYFDKPKAK